MCPKCHHKHQGGGRSECGYPAEKAGHPLYGLLHWCECHHRIDGEITQGMVYDNEDT